jgi:AcrR family transcriptional regulator
MELKPGFDLTTQNTQQELSRRDRERLMRRRLMLDAARAVFAEKGYANATLDEVAQRAEFGKGTIYNYFERGKEEILFAIFDDLYDSLCSIVDQTFTPQLVQERPFRELFEGLLTAVFTFFNDRQDDFLIMIKEGHRISLNDEPARAAYFFEQSERVIRAMVPALQTAIDRGVIRRIAPESMAHMIIGNVKGYHMQMRMEGCGAMLTRRQDAQAETIRDWTPPTPEDSARFIATFLLDGILERG